MVPLLPSQANEGPVVMRKVLRRATFTLGILALLTGPSFALESGVEIPAWPELLAPHADLPNIEGVCCGSDKDQTIVDISPEGKPVFADPDSSDPSTPRHAVIMPND
jgi:hypothetical protein